jgi:hypothetical protein
MNIGNSLRDNQKKAINISYENDFESGVHFHATGTVLKTKSLRLKR